MTKIFILHGWTYSTDKYAKLCELLRAQGVLAEILTVPGLTESTDKVWALDEYVDWLKQKLDPEDQPVVIGHSNGGRIALAFAAKYPLKLKQLILIDSAGIFHNNLSIRIKRLVFGTAAKLGKKITNSNFLRNLLYKFARESDYKNATPQMRKTMANLISVDLVPLLGQVMAPTLIIWGAKDKLTPLSDGKKMNQLIRGSKLYVIDEAGHSPHFTHAQQVSEYILAEVKL